MKLTLCKQCQFWLESDPKLKIGKCSKRNILIESEAGIVWKTKTRIKLCPYFFDK